MALTVGTWNVGEGLGHTDRSEKIVEEIKRIDADILMLVDADWDNGLHQEVYDREKVEEAKETFAQEGYESNEVEYDNYPGHWAGRHLLTLSRIGGDFDSVPFYSPTIDGTSHASRLTVHDPEAVDSPPVEVTGVHLDDQSEQARTEQTEDLAANLNIFYRPTVLMGTLYSMNNLYRKTQFLGSFPVRQLAKLQSGGEPRNDYEEARGRKSNAARMVDMAQGHALEMLFASHLRDIDIHGKPTFHSKYLPNLKLDYIMANRYITAGDLRVHEDTGATRHRAISAEISIAE